ncbi:MAG: glycosyltransferase family 2 protein [Candidatus Nanopelagicaceae bacterium]|nr:glycosyltransferase family 2 protein [Candidatus Nanopelagicaceae bacterium]
MNRNTSFATELAEISQIRKARRADIKEYPKVSVVIATLRSADLENILAQILKQTLPSFELLIGLHNIELNSKHKTLIKKLNARKISVLHFKFAKTATLGEILSSLCEKSTGTYISKMDDDDYYGPEHLRDLIDTSLDTNADVVGRAMNYVYLEPLSLSVRRFSPTGIQAVELWSDWVCGGTILVKREAARKAGWFGKGTTAVDRFLLSNITKNGGKIYRTFGAGYIYRRTFTFHTYVTNYSKYLNNANEQRVGIWPDPIFGTK